MNNNENNQEIDNDLTCSICNDLLYQPVSIACGHTYCKSCLVKKLKDKPICPQCYLPTFVSPSSLKENITLKGLIESKYPQIKFQNRSKYQVLEKNENSENLFSNIFTLITDKQFLFPGLKEVISVKIDGNSEFFNFACQDKKFICARADLIKNKFQPFYSCIVECIEIRFKIKFLV